MQGPLLELLLLRILGDAFARVISLDFIWCGYCATFQSQCTTLSRKNPARNYCNCYLTVAVLLEDLQILSAH